MFVTGSTLISVGSIKNWKNHWKRTRKSYMIRNILWTTLTMSSLKAANWELKNIKNTRKREKKRKIKKGRNSKLKQMP